MKVRFVFKIALEKHFACFEGRMFLCLYQIENILEESDIFPYEIAHTNTAKLKEQGGI